MAKEKELELENEEMEGTEENLPEKTKKSKKTKKEPSGIRKPYSKVRDGIRDNPVTAVVCTAGGVVITLATEVGIHLFRSRKANSEYSEPIEIDDLGETEVDEEPEQEEAE